ncbi:hypothetical protein J6590_006642 [Homalodisca vitripennis]|nr:hypothetical protein J6590_006642 [Homalodisca vitripennis]
MHKVNSKCNSRIKPHKQQMFHPPEGICRLPKEVDLRRHNVASFEDSGNRLAPGVNTARLLKDTLPLSHIGRAPPSGDPTPVTRRGYRVRDSLESCTCTREPSRVQVACNVQPSAH